MKQFLDGDGLQFLVERLVEIINQKTQINVVADIGEDSTNQQIPGAKAVWDLVKEVFESCTKLKAVVVDALPADGEESTIYLIETEQDSGVYYQHMFIGDKWYDLGTTQIDLSGYWEKDELEPITNIEIQEIIDDVMGV